MKTYTSSEVRNERAIFYCLFFSRYQKRSFLTKILFRRRRVDRLPFPSFSGRSGLSIFSCYYIRDLHPTNKTVGELEALFATNCGREAFNLFSKIERLAQLGFDDLQRLDVGCLSPEERKLLDEAIAEIDKLWLFAHREAGMLVNDEESRADIGAAIQRSRELIASQELAVAEIHGRLLPEVR